MGWGDALAVLGGAGQGIVAARQDYQQDQQFRYLQQQRQRMIAQQKLEDAMTQDIQNLPRTRSVEDRSNMPSDWMGPSQATRTEQMPASEYQGLVANRMVASGLPQYIAQGQNMLMQNQQMALLAQQQQAAQRALDDETKRRAVMEKFRPQLDAINNDPKSWLIKQGLPYHDNQVPNGKRGVYSENPDGSIDYALYDEKTGAASGHRTISPSDMREAALDLHDRMIGHELGGISSEDFTRERAQRREDARLGLARDDSAAKRTTADAAMLGAQAQMAHYGPGGTYEQAQKLQRQAQIEAARIQAAAHGKLNPLQQAQLEDLQDYNAKIGKLNELLADPVANKGAIDSIRMNLSLKHADKYMSTLRGTDKDGNPINVPYDKVGEIVKTAYRNRGYDMAPDGVSLLPKGMSSEQFSKLKADAAKEEVKTAVLKDDKTGEPMVGYLGKDGAYYPTVKDAKAAKPKMGVAAVSDVAPAPSSASPAGTSSLGIYAPRSPFENSPLLNGGAGEYLLDRARRFNESGGYFRQPQ